MAMPDIPVEAVQAEPDLATFPVYALSKLVGFVDTMPPTSRTIVRLDTRLVFCLAGAAIAFKTKLQVSVATSSTECEGACVHAEDWQ